LVGSLFVPRIRGADRFRIGPAIVWHTVHHRRLRRPRTARLTRLIVERFWAPVGTGVQPDGEIRFLARYLLSGADGREAARKIDETIQSLPGLAGVPLMEAWLARTIAPASGAAHTRAAVVEPERLHALALLPRA